VRRPEADRPAVVSKRKASGQVILCQGCCCGRTDRGFPEVPTERVKAAWKAGRLNRTIQLTISGCVGPCDVANVAVVLTPAGSTWMGGLGGDAHYDALIRWAEECHTAGSVLPLPEALAARRFEWFLGEPQPGIEPACARPGPPEEAP
jgi:hypothetical protein